MRDFSCASTFWQVWTQRCCRALLMGLQHDDKTHSLSVGHHSFGWFWNYQLNHQWKLCFILERKSGEELHPAFTSVHCNVNTLRKCSVLDLGVATDMCLCVCQDGWGYRRAMCWLKKTICCRSFPVILGPKFLGGEGNSLNHQSVNMPGYTHLLCVPQLVHCWGVGFSDWDQVCPTVACH